MNSKKKDPYKLKMLRPKKFAYMGQNPYKQE